MISHLRWHQIDDEDERELQLDAQNETYNCCRIVALGDGRFSLFSPFDNSDGINLIVTGTIEEIAPYIFTLEQCRAAAANFKSFREELPGKILEALGINEAKPQVVGIKRRA